MNRRLFLKLGTMAAAAWFCPGFFPKSVEAKALPAKNLSLYNPHTGESLGATFSYKGRYVPSALDDINALFRDYRTNEIKEIDIRLLEFLHSITKRLKLTPRNPIHIISAYRSPETNAMLRRRSKRVAKNSFHMKGQAVDIRLMNRSTSALYQCALSLRRGGVGYYPRSHFIHIDVGDFRFW